ncbi:hypothetical protein SAMN02910368_01134 [Lachnospiraceae bacterium G11]|nr:hypothetical protein SAMN02910368_01134 [Lachnospiraceae bacterium G11]
MEKSVFESIMTGINEAIDDAKSEKPILKRHKVVVEPVKVFGADEGKKYVIQPACLKKHLLITWAFPIKLLKHGRQVKIILPGQQADCSA